MKDLILKMSMSLDGFVSDHEGRNAWMFGDDQEAKAFVVETIADASLHIMGSRTFKDMAAFWPTSTGVFASPMNRIPKAVFSRQGPAVLKATGTTRGLKDARADAGGTSTGPLQPGAESWGEAYVASGDLAEEIAGLKARDGRPIVAHGGAAFARSLVAGGLVDQYMLMVHPVVLGKGLPIFSEVAAPRRLERTGSTAFPGGAVALIYRPA